MAKPKEDVAPGAPGNETESQKTLREYHEGDFQKIDPVTGLKRDLDQEPSRVRLDRGETLEDAVPKAEK
jgi:hypothetical protein